MQFSPFRRKMLREVLKSRREKITKFLYCILPVFRFSSAHLQKTGFLPSLFIFYKLAWKPKNLNFRANNALIIKCKLASLADKCARLEVCPIEKS